MNETAYERVIRALREHGKRIDEGLRRDQITAQCPAHADNHPSLGVTDRGDRALIVCRSNRCDNRDIVAALGLTMADLFNERPTYDKPIRYVYDDGRVVKRSYKRDGKKTLPQENTEGTPTLYHASRLADVPEGRYVYLVEGEEDVHTLEANGIVATTAPMGAGSFGLVDVSPLVGKLVVCVVDCDEKGDKWAAQVATKLEGVAKAYRFVRAKVGNDTSDHFAAGLNETDFEPYESPSVSTIVEKPEGRVIRFRAASGIRMTRTRWLHGHERGGLIPVGAITLLAGREGIGKSTISYDFIAKVTTGTLRGEFYGTPKGVVIYATEDDWEPVILPRLIAAGSDTTRVFRADVYEADGSNDWLSFPRDLVRLGEQCREHDVALLVLDPIMSIIDGKLDTHKDREVRQALDPLSRFAAAAGVAVIGLIHVNKSNGSDALNSLMGSRAFSAVARSVLYCIAVPKADGEEAPDEFLFSQEKCNLGPKQGSQRYQISTVALDAVDDDGADFKVYTSKVAWGDSDSRRAGDVMEEANKVTRSKGDLRTELAEWLIKQDDMVPVRDIYDEFESRAKRGTIDTTLSRMAKAGEIERPVNGMYRASRKT